MIKTLRLSATLVAMLLVAISAFSNTYTVTTTDDSGAGSLRQAIADANANPGADTIVFTIPGVGPWSITVSSALPALTGPTVIDGATQPGFVNGTQTTYVKVGAAFTGTIFSASNVTGITIKSLDLSYSSPRNGYGISFSLCSLTGILDNFIRNRYIAVNISGGQTHTVQNNDLLASGENTSLPVIYLNNITPGGLSTGAISGNKFGGNANMGFRVDNMSNLVIGDASVSGAHIVIEDNSGFTAMGLAGQYMLWFNSCNNITIDNVDLSWMSGGVSNSHGIIFSNQVSNSTFTVKNCAIKNRYGGIIVGNGKDVTIQNNDLRGSGHEGNYAVNLSNITEANVNGGILMNGNLWGRNTGVAESFGGLRISGTNNLTIGDATTGIQIKLEDNSGLNMVLGNESGTRGALLLENTSNIIIDNVDVSWAPGGLANAFGIRVNNSGSNGSITIKNCDVRNRYIGIVCLDGKDYTVTGNDLRGSGHENNYAMYLISIAEGMMPGGVLVHSNLWGRNTGVNESHSGLNLTDMSNLVIGDAATGVHIKIEDNSGFNTILGNEGSYRGALWLERVSNITVDNVDASWSPGGIANAFGIFVQNETTAYSSQTTSHRNVTIKNCDFRNRGQGLRIRGGKDYTVTNNDLRGCGEHGHHALQLINIQPGAMTGGILAYTNLFGTGAAAINNGIYIERMSDLSIGDAATGGNIKIEDNSGLNQVVGNDVNNRGALYLNQVSNVTVNSVDCSYATGGQAGNAFAIRVANTAVNQSISIVNCLAGNRGRGIWVDNGRDYTITGNNMVGSGNGNPALELSNIIPGSLTGGILASGNTFGTPNFHRGVVISNMRDLLIGDASVSGANIVLEDNCGLNQCVGGDYNSQGALYLSNVNNVTVDNVDCSKSTAGAGNSYGIVVGNGANNQGVTIKNGKADNRYRGIYCSGGKDYTVQNNTITNSGWDGEACALDFRNVTAGTLPGGILVSGNTFGNVPITANLSRAGVRFDNMRDLYIGDAVTGGNVKLEDGNGLTAVGFEANSNYNTITLSNVNNSTLDNLDVSSAFSGPTQRNFGIRINNSASQGNVTIKDCNIQNRRTGIYITNGSDYTITGNDLTNTGANSSEPAVWLNSLVKNTLDGGIAMSGNTFGGATANTALRLTDMREFTIGDAGVSGADIVLEDGVLSTVGNGLDNVVYLSQINNVVVDNVDFSRTGGTQHGLALRVENGNGNGAISVVNCDFGTRRTGIYIGGGKDYTIQNNDFTNSGPSNADASLWFNGVLAGALPGGLSVSGNTFGGTGANTAARFENLKDIVIGDASVVGRNVTFEDGTSGFSTVGNNANSDQSVLFFSNVTNSSINNVDLTRAGGTQFGQGIYVANGLAAYPFSILNCAVGNRRTGIYLAGGRDFTVQNNVLTGSGNNAGEPALYLAFLTVNSNLAISNNTFGGANFHTGIRVESTSDLLISDGTVSGTHVGVTTANGLGNATGHALYLANVHRMKIQNMDLSFTTATKTGIGIQVTTNGGITSLVEMKSLIVKNRLDGINIASGAGHSVKCSDLSDNTDGLEVAGGVTSFACEQNSFVGNTNYAINSAATITAENNYFGGGAPPVGTPNGVTAGVDATPFLAAAPANCPTTLAAYLELKGNQNLILNGSTTPGTANYTDLGSVKISTAITRTFTINNTGGVALNITSISFTGDDAADFSASALSPASPVPAGGSATFTITFTPGATGLRSTTLSIGNDDPNNNPFTAALQGMGKNVLVVTNTNDSGAGSLRQAITDANLSSDADVIEFNIGSGAQTITNASALPTITQPLTIDGSSQPGFAGTPLITVNTTNGSTTFSASTVTGLTIKYMNLSRPSANFDGAGIDLTGCNEVTILNNVINFRRRGILSSGGRDHTIQNNNLTNTGASDGEPGIWLNSLTARDVPGGIKMSGNVWGYNPLPPNNYYLAGCPLRIDNMNGLVVGDASVSGAHITLEDSVSGLDKSGYNQYCCETAVLYFSNVSDLTIDNVDLGFFFPSPFGYGLGRAIFINNTASNRNVTVKNCNLQYRSRGVDCNSGRDYTIQNNDFQNGGTGEDDACIRLASVTAGSIPAGVTATGNTFGVSYTGNVRAGTALRIANMTGLVIGDAGVSGANIVIADGELNDFKGHDPYCCNRSIFSFSEVSDLTVDNVDLTSTTPGYIGYAINVSNSANNRNVTIKNCAIQSRQKGIHITGGKDYTVTNNDLRNTGISNSEPAIYLSGIRPGALPAGIAASGNQFGFLTQSAKTALRIDNMDGLVIGDAGVIGAHIVIEDNSGANTMNNDGDQAAIYLNGVSNLTVDNVDVSRSAAGRTGVSIWVENGGNTVYRNLSILNCKMQQRDMALYVSGGKDVTLTNNDMRYSGYYQERPALYLSSIQSGTLPGGISMSANKFGGTFNSATSNSGIQMVGMRDLVMADAAAPGVNIVLEDNSGLNDVYGDEPSIRGVLYLSNVRNVQMTSIDLSKMTAGQGTSFALKVNSGVNVSVLNGKGSNRYHGYYFEGGRDITVTGNDLTGSGNQRDYPALRFSNVQPGSINTTNGITASGNLFGGANVRTGLRIDNAKNLLIGDASVGGAHIVLEDASGLNNITQGDGNSEHPAIYLNTVSDIAVDNVDASRASGRDMAGIWVANGSTNSNVTIKNCNFNRHNRAIYCTGGKDYTIQNNTLLNCGADQSQPAIYLQNIQQGSLAGGIMMSGNTFGGTLSFGGVRFENMRDLYIGDASTGGNVKIEDASGLNNMGGNGNSSGYYMLHFINVNNATVDNVDLSRPNPGTPVQDFTGIRVDNSAAYGPISIKNCDLRRHRTGISAQGGKDYTVTGNDLRGCGVSSDEPALYFNNITQQDGTVPMGIFANTNTFGTVNSVVSNCALRLDNLCGIRISDGSVPNSHIKLESASSIKEVTGTGGSYPSVIAMLNNSGMTVEKLDLEFTGIQTGTGIRFQNSNASQYGNIIKDNILKNRRMGVSIFNGSDYTITGNNFQMTGAADDEPAIRMEHVAEGALYGGVSMSGNTFGGAGAAFGLKFVNMSNLKISDGTYPGTNVNLGAWATNGIGELTTGYALHLSGICNAAVSTLDLSRSGTTRQGTGLRLTNGMGNTIEKVFVQGRDAGIQINGTASETIQCNVLYDNNFGFDFVNNSAIRSITFQNNSMHCNTTALRNQLPASFGALNAQNNYWGTATGPTNLGGTGNGYTNTNGGSVNATSFLTLAAACAPTLPDADALGNNVVIEDGDMSPAINDNTLVCGTDVGQTLMATYSIKNNGTGTIRLDGASPVSISPASPVFSVGSQPADLELAAGESTTFTINFTPNALGTFTANVNIENRTCDNDPYNFTVQGQGCTPYTATLSGTPAVCAGQSAMIAVDITGGLAPFTLTLSDGSTHTVNATGSSNLTVSPAMTTAYTITSIYDANNCCATNSGSATVTVNALPTPTITVTDMSGNTNHDGILCSGASATLDAGAFAMYAWIPAGNTQTINAAVAGTYTVTVTDGSGCQNTASATIVVNPNPTPTITETDNSGTANDDIICTGGTATLDAGGGYTTYAWIPSGNSQTIMVSAGGTYTVVVTDANGCTGTDNHVIQENALPVAALSGALLVCPGATLANLDLNITAGVAPFTVVLSDASSHNVAAVGMSPLSVTVAGPGTNNFTISSITGAGVCAGTGSGTASVDFGSSGEIEVSGNGTPITVGDNMPDPADHTDFGLVMVGGNFTRTFTITNSHPTLALSISGVTITGSADFTLMTPPAGTVAANGGTTTFVVKFSPTAPGLASATVGVNSSDCDDAVYDFAVTGKGATPAAALNFDGTDDFVSVPDAGSLDLGSSLTLEAWVKPESFSEYNMIIDKRDLADVNANYGLTLTYGKPMFYFWNGGNQSFHIATNAIALNAFTHLAATYDGAMVRIFVNGTQVYAQAETDVPPSNNQPLSIGRNQVTLQYFDGDIDEVRIWNTVRNCDEIGQRYNCELSVPQPGFVAYYKFNQGFAAENNTTPPVNTLTDATANANNGTLTNVALNGPTSNWVTPGGVTTGTSCPAMITYPEINLQGNGNDIADGDNMPATTDHTDFNGTFSRTFAIHNTTGTALLNINSITSGNARFVISGAPTSVAIGGSATFTVTYNPTDGTAQTATITVNSDDCDEAVYDFVVTATATPAKALHFDGFDDEVIGASPTAFWGPTPTTFEFWVKKAPGADMFVGDLGFTYQARITNGALKLSGFFLGVFTTADNLVPDNVWTHCAFTYDGLQTNTSYKAYINGLPVAFTGSYSSHPPTNGQLRVGIANNNYHFTGSLDEVRAWKEERTAAQILANYNTEIAGMSPCLDIYWKFNQGFIGANNSSVTSATDAANAVVTNGTLSNFALNGATSNWVAGSGITETASTYVPAPEADLLGYDNTAIADGTSSTSVAKGTNFGNVNLGSSSAAQTFTLQNNGTADLNVSSITSSNSQFMLTALTPVSPIPVGMSATFTITFTPTATGVQNATITIANDDCDEAAYNFAVTGTGVCIPPSFSACPVGPLTANTVTGTCAAFVTYTVTEAGNPAPTVTYAFTGATTGSGSGTGSGSSFNKGNTTVTVTATSTCNPAATCSFTVTVTDNEAPTITCPSGSPFARNTDATECNYMVQGTEFDPTAFGDNCPGATITNSFNNSATLANTDLPKGSTTITWTVTDGMAMSSTTCQIVVNVTDNQMPTISCPSGSPFSRNTDATECNYTVQGTEFDPTAFGDNCPGATITNSFNNSSTLANADLPKGPTTITWTVTDGMAMSSTTCAIVVNVSDNQMPTITCPSGSPFARNTDATECNYTVQGTEFDPTAFGDNCPGATITNSFNNSSTLTGADLPKGSTTITWTVTDGMAMSSTTCAIVVTVSDNQAPTITCPSAPPVFTSAYGASTFIGIFNGKAYFDIATGVGNFLNLNAEAVAAGGYIATVETAAEQNFLAAKQGMGLISGLAGIGLYGPKPYLDNDWIGPATSYRAFHPTEPTGASGYVGLYSSYSGLWIDHNTMSSLIVEIPATSALFSRNTDATQCNYTVQSTEFDPTAFGDNCPGATITNSFNNSSTLTGADLPKGSTTITWTVTDGMAMSSTTCQIVINVTDNQMPTISCPSGSPFARNTDATECNYTAQGTEFDPTAFGDNCPGATITNSFNNSSTLANADLPKGPTTIMWTVTDGMAMSSTTCQIVVNVTDNQMPTISCPSGSPFSRNTDATECNYTAQGTEFDPTAFGDNCPGATITNSFNNSSTLTGADLPKGSTTITWTVTDGMAMSSTTCQIVINVTDNQMPTISCPSGSPFARNTDATECNYTAQGTEFDPTAFGDNCPGATITNSFNNSSTLANADLPKGSTTIMWTVTDGMAMSSTTCAIVVHVLFPEINVQGNGADIDDGDNMPDLADHTDFGATTGTPITRTFTIQNTGQLPLSLAIGSITVSGTDAALFTVSNIFLPASVSGPGSITFDVTYTPVGVGTHSATINIASNDCDEATYNFAIQGTRNCSPPAFTACPTAPVVVLPDAGSCLAIVNYAVTGTGTPASVLTYAFAGVTTGSGNGSGSGSAFNQGNTTVTVTATNPCGMPTCVFTVSVSACVEISGTVFWKGDGIAGVNTVHVALTGDATGTDATDVNGAFSVVANTGDDFVLTPSKNTGGMLNGVTAADATVIQQHLTGNSMITDFYRLIAADCNKSNNISSVDAALIRQALLGNPSSLNILNNTGAWRFVRTDYVPVLDGPYFLDHFSLYDKRILASVSGILPGQDFYGIKTGDVFEELNPGVDVANPTLKPDPSAKPLVWRVRDRLLKTGETVDLDFLVANFTDIAAFQYGLRFDSAMLQFESVTITNTGIPMDATGNFGTYQIAKGELRTLWSVAQGMTLSGVQPMYRIRLNVLQGGKKLSEIVSLDPTILSALAYTTELAQREVQLVFTDYKQPGIPTYNDKTGWLDSMFDLLQNRPNPFSDRTTIGFLLPEPCDAQLRVLDLNGREVWRSDKLYPAGYHEEVIRLDEIGASGMLFYELTTPQGKQTRKMMAVGL